MELSRVGGRRGCLRRGKICGVEEHRPKSESKDSSSGWKEKEYVYRLTPPPIPKFIWSP